MATLIHSEPIFLLLIKKVDVYINIFLSEKIQTGSLRNGMIGIRVKYAHCIIPPKLSKSLKRLVESTQRSNTCLQDSMQIITVH